MLSPTELEWGSLACRRLPLRESVQRAQSDPEPGFRLGLRMTCQLWLKHPRAEALRIGSRSRCGRTVGGLSFVRPHPLWNTLVIAVQWGEGDAQRCLCVKHSQGKCGMRVNLR